MASEFQEEENYLAPAGPNTYHFAAIKTGTYYIIVSGNQSKGKLKIDWNIIKRQCFCTAFLNSDIEWIPS